MNKSLVPVLIVVAVIGSAVWIGFNSSSTVPSALTPPPAPGPASPTPPSPAPPSPKADDESLRLSPAQAAKPSATSQAAAATPSTPPTPAPGQPVKTLGELHRTFDAINAAADATTPESLKTLVAYASTENADVRSEALNALVRRGDASAAPALRAAAKQSDSSQETIDLLQTADYLELPSADLAAIEAAAKLRKANAANTSKRTRPFTPADAPAPATATP